MAAPRSIPIYFPEFGTNVNPSIFTGGIDERTQANFNCDQYHPRGIIEQHWSASDTVTFQLHGVTASTYRININGDTYSSTAADSPAPSTVRNWSIPMSSYSRQDIRMVLEFDTGVGWVTLATSPLMRVHSASDSFLNCTRLIEYWGEGLEVGVYYGDDADSPTFKQYLRIPASLRFAGLQMTSNIVQKDRDGNWNVCFNSSENTRTFATSHIPLWMHETLNYVMQHRKVEIDGTRYVFDTAFRTNRGISGTNLFTGDMTVKMAEHLYTTTRAN